MLTFLDLVNDFITEFGINGGQLLTSTGGGTLSPSANTPGQNTSPYNAEVARLVKWIADADYEIQSEHHDWKFLWRQYQNTLAVGQDWLATPQTLTNAPAGYVSTPYTLRKVDRYSLSINYSNVTSSYRVPYLEWRQFERLWQSRGAKQASDYPAAWTLTPAGNPLLSHTSATGLGYQYECWVRPQRMVADGDVSPLVAAVLNNNADAYGENNAPNVLVQPQPVLTPSTAGSLANNGAKQTYGQATGQQRNESCRIILARAAVMWATAEGATDILQGALAEYDNLIEQLRADQLPGMEGDRMGESDVHLVMITE